MAKIGEVRLMKAGMNKGLFALFFFLTSIAVLAQNLLAQTPKAPKTTATSPTLAAPEAPESSRTIKPGARVNSAQADENAKKYYKLGMRYWQARLFKQAETTFMLAIRLRPNYAEAYQGLGNAYFGMGRWKEAIESFEQVIRFDSNNASVYAQLGEAHTRLRAETRPLGKDDGVAAARGITPASPPSPSSNDIVAIPESKGQDLQKPLSATSPANTTPLTQKPNEIEGSLIYRVGIGDVLDVRLRDAPANQSSLFTVSASGLLEHPILSQPLRVLGLTTDEISQRIASDLKSRAIHEAPEILVGVREYVSHTLLVSGLVKEPGRKILRREAIPLYVMIAEAQPLPEAGRAVIITQRPSQTITVDLSDPTPMDLLIRSGDVISFQPSPKHYLYIGGEIKAPGERSFRSGMTLTQAILAAGGLTRDAGKEVRIARQGVTGRLVVTRYKLKDIDSGKLADPLIEPGDRITVAH